MNPVYDIAIVGSGLIGSTLAVALSRLPLKIVVIDSKSNNLTNESFQDARSLALSRVSYQIYRTLNLWPLIADYATPIKKIHVSDKGRFAFSHIHANDFKVDALGYVVEYYQLEKILWEAIKQDSKITCLIPAAITAIQEHEEYIQLKCDTQETVHARLVVACDGANSSLRSLCNITHKTKDYNQQAIVANIGLQHDHGNIAYERFTAEGPLALLPLSEKRVALVWTQSPDATKSLIISSDGEFLAELQKVFGYRLGKFIWVGKRQMFPLRLVYAQENVKSRMVLIGNASHTLHPVAGQGFNLGLRDVAHLFEMINNSLIANTNFADIDSLKNYDKKRAWDRNQIISFTDQLINIFSNDLLPLVLVRGIGLNSLDLLPGLKGMLASKTMGYSVKLPQDILGNHSWN